MSGFGVWSNGYLRVQGFNLSSYVRDMGVDIAVAELAANTHGDSVAKVLPGLEKWHIIATFLQDFALTKVDAVLSPLVKAGVDSVDLIIGPTQTPTTTTPWYRGFGIVTGYTRLRNPHGGNLDVTATFQVVSSLRRITSSTDGGLRVRPKVFTARHRPKQESDVHSPKIYNGRP